MLLKQLIGVLNVIIIVDTAAIEGLNLNPQMINPATMNPPNPNSSNMMLASIEYLIIILNSYNLKNNLLKTSFNGNIISLNKLLVPYVFVCVCVYIYIYI